MQPANLLFLFSDQHARDALGCYGNPIVQTPNLDRLAARGTRFQNAYTTCPICVPARANLATGYYVHQIRHWDNAFPYDGAAPSWMHRLREQGHRVDSIGKLHFSKVEDDHGFTEEIDPLHVVDGIGDILGSIRDDPPFRSKRKEATGAGTGDSTYLHYDASNANHAIEWLADRAQEDQSSDKPWALFLSFVCPHPPYTAPEELFALYPPDESHMPPQWREEDWPHHPAMDYFRKFFGYEEPLSEADIKTLTAAYYGVCTYLDQQMGRVLDALDAQGLAENTRIIYASDHGESLGARGMVGKFTMYDESSAVPLIIAGPDAPVGHTVLTPVSLVDVYPSMLEAVGASPAPEDADKPGVSLWEQANQPDRDRTVLCEYHALGSENASYLLRSLKYKYSYHVNAAPQLFDMDADPQECVDLAGDPGYHELVQSFEAELRVILDPEAVDAQAKADQRKLVDDYGRDEVIARGSFANSPTPGVEPAFE